MQVAVQDEAISEKEKLPAWSTYAFQYQGRQVGGRKVIYVNGFCHIPDYAAKRMVVVFDGGSCYFSALYDVESKAYTNVRFNGDA